MHLAFLKTHSSNVHQPHSCRFLITHYFIMHNSCEFQFQTMSCYTCLLKTCQDRTNLPGLVFTNEKVKYQCHYLVVIVEVYSQTITTYRFFFFYFLYRKQFEPSARACCWGSFAGLEFLVERIRKAPHQLTRDLLQVFYSAFQNTRR